MPVTTWIIPFFVGNPYKPSFVTVTGWGGRPKGCTLTYTTEDEHVAHNSMEMDGRSIFPFLNGVICRFHLNLPGCI